MDRTITVLMDLPATRPSYGFTVEALAHAIGARPVGVRVVGTDQIDRLGQGVVIGPGSPYRDPGAAESAIRQARRDEIPLVGT